MQHIYPPSGDGQSARGVCVCVCLGLLVCLSVYIGSICLSEQGYLEFCEQIFIKFMGRVSLETRNDRLVFGMISVGI